MTESLVRISVGIEDSDDLIQDIKNSLERFNKNLYELFLIDLPDGSIIFSNSLSHFKASSVLQATDFEEGTHNAQSSPGKCFFKIF